MPYVPQHDRPELHPESDRPAHTEGELNFQITSLFVQYLTANGLSYATINDILGAATGARSEFYRRVAIPYEDHKIDVNGDVYLAWQVGREVRRP